MYPPPVPPALAVPIVLLAIVLVVYLFRAFRRARAVRSGTWVQLEVKGQLLDIPPPVPPLRRLFMRRTMPSTILAIRRLALDIADDSRVTGVVLKLGELRCGWATAASLRDVIASLRAAGKRVIVHLPHGAGTREIYVAVAGDQVFATPASTIAPLGVAAGSSFYKHLLDRFGIDPAVISRGEFKSAAEPFTGDSLSEPNRVQIDALVATLHDALVDALAKGRNRSPDDARAWVDGAFLRAPLAAEKGLIDGVAYDDEIASKLGKDARVMKSSRYASVARTWALLPWRMVRGKRVAIVEVHGAIVNEAQTSFGRVADATRITAALRIARMIP